MRSSTQGAGPQSLQSLIRRYARACEAAAGQETIRLNPPSAAAAIAAYRGEAGEPFPEELAELYAVANGEQPDALSVVFSPYTFSPVEEMVGLAQRVEQSFRLSGSRNTVAADDRDRGLQPSRYNVGWIPFGRLGDGTLLAVDTVPTDEGTFGQIVAAGGPAGTDPVVVARSIRELLERNIDAVEQKRYRLIDQDGEEYLPGEAHDLQGTYTVEPENFTRQPALRGRSTRSRAGIPCPWT